MTLHLQDRPPATTAAPTFAPASASAHAGAPAPADGDAAVALRLVAGVLDAASLAAAAHGLVAALARELALERCTLGRVRSGTVELLASTALELSRPGRPDGERAQLLAGAMAEALAQGRAVAVPALPGDDALRHENDALHAATGAAIATLPLGLAGEPFGALCLERRTDAPFDAPTLARAVAVLALAVPALRWMARAEQPLRRHVADAVADAAHALRHPARRTLRRLLAAGAAGLVFIAVVPLEREVGGRARLEGAEQRLVAAPVDGFVKAVHVRPGDRVRAGQPLVDLVDGDQKLEHERLAAQLAQHENAYAAAMAKSDRTAAATAMAQVGETQAQLALVDDQLARGRIVAPFDALVIQGDLAQSAGAPVRQGDTLLTLATTGRQRVVVEVDETDIAQVRAGEAGSLALSALPWQREALVVERIAPIARAVEGRNVFEVEARLVAPDAALRPGLIGRANLVVGRSPPLWSWTRHLVDRVRVAWWAWIA